MRITSFIHPVRTFLPCSGVGRHMNQMLLHLHRDPRVEVRLLFSRQWLVGGGMLPVNCPLRDMPFTTFPWPENPVERLWKLVGRPRMDAYVAPGSDWIYCPMETYFPMRTRIPTAITLHDIHPFEPHLPGRPQRLRAWQRWKWSRWVRRAIDSSTVVFTVSEFSKGRMVDLLDAPAGKIVVVGNGVEEPFFRAGARAESDFPRLLPEPYVLIIGGLRHAKGGGDSLEVARELRKCHSDIHVVVAGPSDEALALQARDHPNVRLLGMQPDEALPGLLKHAVALLFLSPYEGFGIPALEAMAVGTPAIVANRAALPEVVGDAGLVVEPDHARQIADLCIHLSKDAAARGAVAAKGRRHVAPRTWEACKRHVMEALTSGHA